VRTNFFIPRRFWTTRTKFDTCCLRYIATCGKILYTCTSAFFALNYCGVCGGIFFKSLSYLYEVVRTNFSADFWTFRNFWRNFAKIVAAPSNEKEKFVVQLKEQSILKKKRWKPHQNRPINRHTMLVWTISPRAGRPSVTYKNAYFGSYSRRAYSSIFSKLCMVIDFVVPIKIGGYSFFDPTHIFS